ncbi:TetR/AcrR family transcriptional regulator [Rhodopila sp.]|uniref:TetR/AcrR family transcriptional regulator n=1 Tax=Rhodopila sp. TaxID=2480087 RepID=UPI003D141991
MRQPSKAPVSREERVLEAATEVFLRYGFARTTMGDIAERVGISRPALYLVFAGKEEVFAAVIQRMNDDQLAGIRAVLPKLPTSREKVLFACKTWGAHGMELMAAHPDAKDLFNLAFIPVQQMYAKFQALIAELLIEPAAASSLHATPEQLARVLIFAMRGFRETAVDAADARRLIALQVSVLLTALESRG